MARTSPRLAFLALLLLCWHSLCAQDTSLPLTIDAGVHFHGVDRINQPYIRGDLHASGFLRPGMSGYMEAQFAGVKLEKFLPHKNRFGFSVGLRYTNILSIIHRRGSPSYFYVLHRQEGTTTEYLRLKNLKETSHYIGIPLEARLYIGTRRRWFLLAGGEWSYQIARQVAVNFNDPGMNIFTADIKSLVHDASESYGSCYVGAGLRLGRKRPRWTIGYNVPIVITKTVSGLNTARSGVVGMHLQYLLSKSHTW